MSEATDLAGSLVWGPSIRIGNRTSIAATGFIAIAGGTGTRTIRGVGLRFIMAAGFVITVLVGVGRRIQCGVRRGSHGDTLMIFAAGLHCRPAPASHSELDLHSTDVP